MRISITLPATFTTCTLRELLEQRWLVPRKVRHFLRVRKNVQINQQAALFHFPVHAGDEITLFFEESDYVTPTILPGDRACVQVLYEDAQLIVIEKPPGMKTHPNQPDENQTLLNHLAAYLAPKQQMPYVVHRLDKETSGVILFAKNPFVLPIVSRMLEQKKIYRQYQALVAGNVQQATWTIDKPIGRHRHDRRKRVVDFHHGDTALTHVKRVAYFPENAQTALTCILETGRTHQIRVHLASEGLPIIGDPLYHPHPTGRLLLHAKQLTLQHPFTNERLTIDSQTTLWSEKTQDNQ